MKIKFKNLPKDFQKTIYAIFLKSLGFVIDFSSFYEEMKEKEINIQLIKNKKG